MIYYHIYASPVGKLCLIANDVALIGIEFEQAGVLDYSNWQEVCDTRGGEMDTFCKIFANTCDLLDRYFDGESVVFEQLDFLLPQGTPFQQAVWQALRGIPYGQAVSYADIARKIGKPNAVRAVANAVGRNPISILVPCHRVLGKNQALTGFGGGLPIKRYLLNLENIAYKDLGIEFVSLKRKKWG